MASRIGFVCFNGSDAHIALLLVNHLQTTTTDFPSELILVECREGRVLSWRAAVRRFLSTPRVWSPGIEVH